MGAPVSAPQQFTTKNAVAYATVAALPTCVYANGVAGSGATLTAAVAAALSIDGAVVSKGQRVLVLDQVATTNNGIFTVLNAGSVSDKWVLMRAADCNSPATITPGMVVAVAAPAGAGGAKMDGSLWVSSAPLNFRVGVDPLTWSQIGPPLAFAAAGDQVIGGTVANVPAAKAGDALGIGISNSGAYLPLDDASRTLEMWVKGTPTAGYQTLAMYGSNSNNKLFRCTVNSAGHIHLDISDDNRTGTVNVLDGAWHHLAFENDSGNGFSMWVDGTQDGGTGPSLGTTAGALSIGYSQTDAVFYPAATSIDIAAVAMYPTALSPSQLAAHIAAAASGYVAAAEADGALFLWLLDEASGTDAVDSTGQGRDLTYTGTVLLADTTGPINGGLPPGHPVIVAIGAAGRVWTSNGPGKLPSWAPDAGGGSLTTLAVTTTFTPVGGTSYWLLCGTNGGGFLVNPAVAPVQGDEIWVTNIIGPPNSNVVTGPNGASTTALGWTTRYRYDAVIAGGYVIVSDSSGNYNTADNLVRLDGAGAYPAADGSAITNLPLPSAAVLAAGKIYAASTFR